MRIHNRIVNSVLAFLLIFSLVSPSVSYAATAGNALANGVYDVPFTVLKEGSSEPSVMDDYTKKPARVTVKNGSYQVDFTITNSNWYKDFTVEGKKPEVISDTPETGERTVRFTTNEETVKAWVHIVVTGIPGFNYDNSYNVDIAFDYEDATVIELDETEQPEEEQPEQPETEQPEEEQPEQPETEQPEEEQPEQPETEQPEEEQPEQPETEQPEEEQPEQPEEQQPSKPDWSLLETGTYNVPFAAKHATEDRDSAMSRYLVNPAHVVIDGTESTLALTVKESHQITDLVLSSGEVVEASSVEDNEEENTRTYTFSQKELHNPTAAKVSMRVEMPNGMVYENTQDFRMVFDLNKAEKVAEVPGTPNPEVPEEPEVPKPETPNPEVPTPEQPQQPEEPAYDELVDGQYTIDFSMLKAGSTDVSVMDSYTEKPATVYVKDGMYTVDLTLLNQSWYRDLTMNGDQPEVVRLNEEEDKRVVRFHVSSLEDIADVWVHIRVDSIPGFNYDNQYDADLVFDYDSLTLIEKDQLPGPIDEDGKENPDGDGGELPKEEEKPKEDDNGNKPNDPKPINEDELVNGEYTIDFSVFKKGTSELSVMDGYTKKPANVFLKDGRYTIDLTLTNSNWYEDLTINGARPEVVYDDLEKQEKTVRFETDQLSEAVDAWVHIIVTGIPGFEYDNQYEVDIQFSPESVTLVKAEETPTVTDNDSNNGDGAAGNNDTTNLTYDRVQHNGDTGNSTAVQQQNPQTSDHSLVSMYVAMLLLSLSFFVWKWQRSKRMTINH
ncbi:NEAT domain-containing protein [Shouchella sp. JSM 1781072]|uniref:NEAT domain-containing protein n=1 Tax=Shouchella sp. JSM 1781072 TaxID=3344581 RepID=UPI0035C22A16